LLPRSLARCLDVNPSAATFAPQSAENKPAKNSAKFADHFCLPAHNHFMIACTRPICGGHFPPRLCFRAGFSGKIAEAAGKGQKMRS
jgi:hypothetical protein